MQEMRERARELMPSVLLTFLSIIQALALELLWTSLHASPHLWSTDWIALLGWIQEAAIALGILLVWLFYTSIVMRFSWIPSTRDSILPFAIGLLEFTLIDLAGPDTFGPWFYTLAGIFAVSVWASHVTFVRARQDTANRSHFTLFEPSSLRDYLGSIGVIVGLVLVGIVLHASGSRGWLALFGLLGANAAILWQTLVTRRYWHMSMRESSEA